VFAALDLGTNNCRLLVARPAAHGFRVIDAFSRIVRLGERVNATGTLARPAMDRAQDALSVCAAKLQRRGVTHFRGVATEACRRASNGEAFLAQVQSATGLRLEIIAPREEAELALAGCVPLLDPTIGYGLLFDIGGGSTEITLIERLATGGWRIVESISIARGVVSLTERLGDGRVAAEDYAQVVDEICGELAPFATSNHVARLIVEGRVQMIGTSGTVTTLSGLRMQLPRYDRRVVDGSWLEFDEIFRRSRELAELDLAGRAAVPCIGHERADLVIAGCAILEAICVTFPVGRLRVADRGLREGIILGLMAGQRAAATAHGG
jgi:exopolyphosphatase/guanosine-5'-triphosphate,3'-diphosphate pyrophosphatase